MTVFMMILCIRLIVDDLKKTRTKILCRMPAESRRDLSYEASKIELKCLPKADFFDFCETLISCNPPMVLLDF